jgi:hypothetical protein
VKRHIFEVVDKLLGFCLEVVTVKGWIITYWVCIASNVKAKARGWAVMVVVDMCENGVVNARVLSWVPDHLHTFVAHSQGFVLAVDPCEEPSIKPKLVEKCCVCGLVSERIDMPTDLGNHAKGILNPPQPDSHLIDDIFVVGTRLIRHTPTRIDDLQLFVVYVGGEEITHGLVGVVPPAVQEGDLDNREFVGGVKSQLGHDGIDSVLDASPLSAHVATIVVVVDRLEPANVVVAVGHDPCGNWTI